MPIKDRVPYRISCFPSDHHHHPSPLIIMPTTPTNSRLPIIDLSPDSPFSEAERAAQIRHALGTGPFNVGATLAVSAKWIDNEISWFFFCQGFSNQPEDYQLHVRQGEFASLTSLGVASY